LFGSGAKGEISETSVKKPEQVSGIAGKLQMGEKKPENVD
jgi:hypothetical protein